MSGHLALKFGTFKSCDGLDSAARDAANAYFSLENSASTMGAVMTEDAIDALCKLIDCVDEPITNDWSGEDMTREEAKAYVMEYRR